MKEVKGKRELECSQAVRREVVLFLRVATSSCFVRVVVALLASVKQSRRRPLCWANRLSRLVASLMAVTKEQATFPPIH